MIQVIIAGWNNFRSMVTGFEVANIKKDIIVKDVPEDENNSASISTNNAV